MSAKTMVLIEKGTGKTVQAGEIQIPDLWHIAMLFNKNPGATGNVTITIRGTLATNIKDCILETWHLAHAMKEHIVKQTED